MPLAKTRDQQAELMATSSETSFVPEPGGGGELAARLFGLTWLTKQK
jgi:hypothetical protein